MFRISTFFFLLKFRPLLLPENPLHWKPQHQFPRSSPTQPRFPFLPTLFPPLCRAMPLFLWPHSLFPWSNSRHVATTPNSTPSLNSFSMRSESHFFTFQSPQLDALEFSFQCPKPIKSHFLFSTKLGFCGSSFNHFSHRSAIGFKCGRYPFAKDSVFANSGVFLWGSG